MSMSKQDFIALADALRGEKPADHWDPNKKAQWENDCRAIARVCKRANSAFKEDRWFAYIAGDCGPNGGAVKTVRRGDTPSETDIHVQAIRAEMAAR